MRAKETQPAPAAISRPVEILIGTRAIAAFLGVSQRTVRTIERQGAPIVRDSGGVMRAEKAEIWGWWRG